MKYYTPNRYTGKAKQKRIMRITLIVSLSVGILVGTAVLGNLFLNRLRKAEQLLALTPVDYTLKDPTAPVPEYTAHSEKRSLTSAGVCGALSIDSATTAEALRTAVAENGSFTGVSVTVSDEGGARFSRRGEETANGRIDASMLTHAAVAAKKNGMHISATLHTSHSAQDDGAWLTELTTHGIFEVVLCGFETDTLTDEQTYTLLLYLEQLRKAAPHTTVILALPPALFSDAASAVHLDTLVLYYDALAADMSRLPDRYGDFAAYVSDTLPTLYGSFAYYDLALLTDGTALTDEVLSSAESLGVKAVRCRTDDR